MGHRGQGEPGGVGGEPAGRQMCERSVDEIGEELFDDGVTAVGHIGVHAGQVGVGQERVVASHREQFVLAGWCRVEFADPADHQPCGDLVDGGFEGGVAGFSDLGVRDPLPGQLVEHRTRGSAPVSTRARRWRRWPPAASGWTAGSAKSSPGPPARADDRPRTERRVATHQDRTGGATTSRGGDRLHHE